MSTYSTILFYKFFPVADHALFRLWQRELCLRLELKGRIIVSPHGINGTLGGERAQLRTYLREVQQWPAMGKLDPKWDHELPENPFPRLSVKARDELVTFQWPEVEVTPTGIANPGAHLRGEQLDELLRKYLRPDDAQLADVIGRDVLFLDGRNDYEFEVGRFAGAYDSGVRDAKGFEPLLESGQLDEWKNKPVVTYCTGGIRCEILTPLMKKHGFHEVYQIDGGIIRYLEETRNGEGLWEGSVYTFDKRLKLFSELATVVGKCTHCGTACDDHRNCRSCDQQVLACSSCWEAKQGCSTCRP